jgi:hypothetical protein
MKLEFGLDKAIFIWSYDNLPDEIKVFMQSSLISNSDLDWVAILPKIYDQEYIPWLECPSFGCCRVIMHPIGTVGDMLVMGYHS